MASSTSRRMSTAMCRVVPKAVPPDSAVTTQDVQYVVWCGEQVAAAARFHETFQKALVKPHGQQLQFKVEDKSYVNQSWFYLSKLMSATVAVMMLAMLAKLFAAPANKSYSTAGGLRGLPRLFAHTIAESKEEPFEVHTVAGSKGESFEFSSTLKEMKEELIKMAT